MIFKRCYGDKEHGNMLIEKGKIFKKNNKPCLSLLLVMVIIMFTSCTAWEGENSSSQGDITLPADEDLTIYFLDVGQADSTILVSEGEAMLIDAGNRGDGDYIVSCLHELGIQKLKYVVFTHPHEDHIGGGEAVVDSFGIDKIYMLDEYEEGIEGQLKEAIEARGIENQAPQPGERTALGECSIEFFGPFEDYGDANDDSICLKISHGSNSTLFTGDAGSAPEREMIEAGFDLEVDILQAGHHGSSTSNTYYFLRQANPKYVVISCEKGNMYGHPHEEALSRFNDLGAEVFRTDEQGTVIAVDNGREITFNCSGKKASRPYTPEEDAKYIGNANSKKYHLPTCGGASGGAEPSILHERLCRRGCRI
ncbi:MAG: MBL fold metallo-hydrolase [Clostridiales bacterium]|nr:MBL fold metallo-hydrolase [Clostridiales bacterium]